MNADLAGAHWRKSSYSSGSGGNCVEVATNLPGLVAVRDLLEGLADARAGRVHPAAEIAADLAARRTAGE